MQVRAASPTRAARQRSSMGGGMDTSAHRRTTHSRSAALMDLSASAKEGAAMLLRRYVTFRMRSTVQVHDSLYMQLRTCWLVSECTL